ncbi:MAG: hypothetical protein WC668_00625 [Patescibacteria group bacterium]|jgi:hypothetical protein
MSFQFLGDDDNTVVAPTEEVAATEETAEPTAEVATEEAMPEVTEAPAEEAAE